MVTMTVVRVENKCTLIFVSSKLKICPLYVMIHDHSQYCCLFPKKNRILDASCTGFFRVYGRDFPTACLNSANQSS